MARNRIEVDETLETPFNAGYLFRLFRYVLKYRKALIRGLILMVLTSILSLATPYLVKIAVDDRIPNADIPGLLVIAGLMLLSIILSNVFLRKRIITTSNMGNSIVRDLRKDIFSHVQKLSFDFFDSRPHGKILVRIVNYVNSLSELLSQGIINLINDLMSLVFILAFMMLLNVPLSLIVLAGLPILAIAIFVIKRMQRRAWQIFSNKNSNLNAYIHESILGIRVIQAFNRQNFNKKLFEKLSDEYRFYWIRGVKANLLIPIVIGLMSTLSVCLIYIGGITWFDEAITVGVLIAFLGYIGRFWQPILNMGNLYNEIITAMAYLERIFETMDEEPDIKDKTGAGIMPVIKGTVEYKDVLFSYDKGHNILEGINLRIEPGTTVALVGPTGAGKTTIVNILCRFYDIDSGQILIDGHDISQMSIRSLRRQMGVMLQDPFIFSGSIMDNIRYGRLNASDEEVIEAAKRVYAHEFITEMDEGYETEVNERGSRLSVGQRQLISFARTLLADPRILILDEATSSIDTNTEVLVQAGLKELLKGRTSFVIAHRLSTIKDADIIMYISDKNIQEKGSHQELMSLKGRYYELYMHQYDYTLTKHDQAQNI